jgi:hypothetical protein
MVAPFMSLPIQVARSYSRQQVRVIHLVWKPLITPSRSPSRAPAATYTLGIAVMDATDTANPSGLLIDKIQVTPVPEPTTVAFSIAGASLLMALRRRIKKTA